MSVSWIALVVAALAVAIAVLSLRIERTRGFLASRARWLLSLLGVRGALPAPAEPPEPAPQRLLLRAVSARIVLHEPRATRHPILLAHGWFGFDRIGVPRFAHDYFRGVPGRLATLGHRVHVARVSPVGSVQTRAAQLARQVEQLGGGRVNIIAHSMGGLDARLAIARLGLDAHVASLTTIGTPHHGTPLADVAMDYGEWRRLRRMLAATGFDVDGLFDISTARMREFNAQVTDSPRVAYASVVGVMGARVPGRNALLAIGHGYLLARSGPNDGLVPAWSQRWGGSVLEVEADHWAQVNWFGGGFDALGFYAQLAEQLAECGF
ncbi:MAG: alpha/beta fold hydrolase [Polyangiales bacterium]